MAEIAAEDALGQDGQSVVELDQQAVGRLSRMDALQNQAMAKAQRRVDQLSEQLEGVTDHTELATLGADLAEAQAELTELEDRWLELSDQ